MKTRLKSAAALSAKADIRPRPALLTRAEFICLSFGFAILFLATVLTQVMP